MGNGKDSLGACKIPLEERHSQELRIALPRTRRNEVQTWQSKCCLGSRHSCLLHTAILSSLYMERLGLLLKPAPSHSLRPGGVGNNNQKIHPENRSCRVHNSPFSTSKFLNSALSFLGFPDLGLFLQEDSSVGAFVPASSPSRPF